MVFLTPKEGLLGQACRKKSREQSGGQKARCYLALTPSDAPQNLATKLENRDMHVSHGKTRLRTLKAVLRPTLRVMLAMGMFSKPHERGGGRR